MEPWMNFNISKEFHFSASHQLNGLPDDHQCARLHGHNYILNVGLGGHLLNEVGFVLDYGDLSFVKKWVDEMDHRHLNDLFNFNPTSEMICQFFVNKLYEELSVMGELPRLSSISVGLSETPKTWCYAGIMV